jgi:hypothetical protein
LIHSDKFVLITRIASASVWLGGKVKEHVGMVVHPTDCHRNKIDVLADSCQILPKPGLEIFSISLTRSLVLKTT